MNVYEILNVTYKVVPITSLDKNLAPNWDGMTLETIAHLAWHGLKQKINDPNGAKTATDSEKLANSQKVLDSIEANEFRMVSGRISDPYELEYMRLAKADYCNRLLENGFKLKDYKMAQITEGTESMLERYPELADVLRTAATATVNSRLEALERNKNLKIEI